MRPAEPSVRHGLYRRSHGQQQLRHVWNHLFGGSHVRERHVHDAMHHRPGPLRRGAHLLDAGDRCEQLRGVRHGLPDWLSVRGRSLRTELHGAGGGVPGIARNDDDVLCEHRYRRNELWHLRAFVSLGTIVSSRPVRLRRPHDSLWHGLCGHAQRREQLRHVRAHLRSRDVLRGERLRCVPGRDADGV
jgi:hypothetical protein